MNIHLSNLSASDMVVRHADNTETVKPDADRLFAVSFPGKLTVNDTIVLASLAPVALIVSPLHMASPAPVHDTDTAEPAAALLASTVMFMHKLAGWPCGH